MGHWMQSSHATSSIAPTCAQPPWILVLGLFPPDPASVPTSCRHSVHRKAGFCIANELQPVGPGQRMKSTYVMLSSSPFVPRQLTFPCTVISPANNEHPPLQPVSGRTWPNPGDRISCTQRLQNKFILPLQCWFLDLLDMLKTNLADSYGSENEKLPIRDVNGV